MPAKRELISPRGDKRYIRRDAKGRIVESDDVSRSLSSDRRRKARKTSAKGQGDRGDRPVAKRGKAAKATAKSTKTGRKTGGRATARKSTRAASKRRKPSLPAHRAPIVA